MNILLVAEDSFHRALQRSTIDVPVAHDFIRLAKKIRFLQPKQQLIYNAQPSIGGYFSDDIGTSKVTPCFLGSTLKKMADELDIDVSSSFDEEITKIDTSYPDTLSQFLIHNFGEKSPIMYVLKSITQGGLIAIEHVFRRELMSYGVNFKDVQGGWMVFLKMNAEDGHPRVIHRRKEEIFKFVVTGMESICQFEWEIEIAFTSKHNTSSIAFLDVRINFIIPMSSRISQNERDSVSAALREIIESKRKLVPPIQSQRTDYKKYQLDEDNIDDTFIKPRSIWNDICCCFGYTNYQQV